MRVKTYVHLIGQNGERVCGDKSPTLLKCCKVLESWLEVNVSSTDPETITCRLCIEAAIKFYQVGEPA